MAANGEIYNYKELYDLLKKEGVPHEPNTGFRLRGLDPALRQVRPREGL